MKKVNENNNLSLIIMLLVTLFFTTPKPSFGQDGTYFKNIYPTSSQVISSAKYIFTVSSGYLFFGQFDGYWYSATINNEGTITGVNKYSNFNGIGEYTFIVYHVKMLENSYYMLGELVDDIGNGHVGIVKVDEDGMVQGAVRHVLGSGDFSSRVFDMTITDSEEPKFVATGHIHNTIDDSNCIFILQLDANLSKFTNNVDYFADQSEKGCWGRRIYYNTSNAELILISEHESKYYYINQVDLYNIQNFLSSNKILDARIYVRANLINNLSDKYTIGGKIYPKGKQARAGLDEFEYNGTGSLSLSRANAIGAPGFYMESLNDFKQLRDASYAICGYTSYLSGDMSYHAFLSRLNYGDSSCSAKLYGYRCDVSSLCLNSNAFGMDTIYYDSCITYAIAGISEYPQGLSSELTTRPFLVRDKLVEDTLICGNVYTEFNNELVTLGKKSRELNHQMTSIDEETIEVETENLSFNKYEICPPSKVYPESECKCPELLEKYR
jgi:hypothetical protein